MIPNEPVGSLSDEQLGKNLDRLKQVTEEHIEVCLKHMAARETCSSLQQSSLRKFLETPTQSSVQDLEEVDFSLFVILAHIGCFTIGMNICHLELSRRAHQN